MRHIFAIAKETPMSDTPALDPRKRALILIDVQNEYFDGGLQIEYPPREISIANILRAAQAALAAKIPVVPVRQNAPKESPLFATNSHGWALHDSIANLPHALVVDKILPSALAGTPLSAWLRAERIGTLTIAGYMTQNCVESTIRQAAHEGFEVELLADAAGAVSYANAQGYASAETIHNTSCIVMQSRFAAVMTTQNWLDVLAGRTAPLRENIFDSVRQARSAVENAVAAK
jgi:nicotinamidase-related amidase